MAESPSSTSENTPNQELGLGLLIPGIKPSYPISTGQVLDIQSPDKPSQNGPDGEDNKVIESTTELEFRNAIEREIDEFRNAMEREIYELTIDQAEKETARERLEASNEGKGVSNVETVKKCELDEGEDFKDEGSFESGNENERGDEESEGNVDGKSGDAVAKLGQYNQGSNRRKVSFPMRPDAEDCAFYMKFGSCKFGMQCKFNHPPGRNKQGVKERSDHREESSEKAGQTECKYYLTSGGCKYGSSCKYSHEKSSTSQIPEFNFLGLPIRPGEKECPYYMRNGSCKYGSNCRFHHPDPTTAGGDSPSGYGNGGSLQSLVPSPTSWSPPRTFNEASPFVPVLFPPRQGASTSNPEWNGYQAPAYPTPERILPTPPAFALNNLPTDNNFHMRHQHNMVVEEYPERPGEPECSFFLKTGDCKFKSNCKFHHPKNRVSKARANTYTLSDKGLPLRPDQPICTHYHRYGICKYGPACKYDHPSNFAASPPPFDHPPFSNPTIGDGSDPTIGDGSDNFRRRNQS